MDFILADVDLVGTESFSFYLSLAKYITLISKIVAQLAIFARQYILDNADNNYI